MCLFLDRLGYLRRSGRAAWGAARHMQNLHEVTSASRVGVTPSIGVASSPQSSLLSTARLPTHTGRNRRPPADKSFLVGRPQAQSPFSRPGHPRREVKACSDAELVELILAGDRRALAETYRRHHRSAYAIAHRVLHDQGWSEDAVQEAFADLWRTAAKFDPGRAGLSTWITVLTHRRAVDIARREARRLTGTYDVDSAPGDTYIPEESVILREQQRNVRAAVEGLPERLRAVVTLAYYGGLTQTEIAERLHIPHGTAKSRMSTAHKILRQSLVIQAAPAP